MKYIVIYRLEMGYGWQSFDNQSAAKDCIVKYLDGSSENVIEDVVLFKGEQLSFELVKEIKLKAS